MRTRLFGLCVCALLFGSCDGPPSGVEAPPVSSVPRSNADVGENAASKTGSTRREFNGISFLIPSEWQPGPPSSVIDAKYVIPSETGEMYLTLTSMRGGIGANVDRFVGQIRSSAAVDTDARGSIDIDGREGMWVDRSGTFNGSGVSTPGPHESWRMLCAAIALPEGDFYVRLVGPSASIAAIAAEFRGFVEDAKVGR